MFESVMVILKPSHLPVLHLYCHLSKSWRLVSYFSDYFSLAMTLPRLLLLLSSSRLLPSYIVIRCSSYAIWVLELGLLQNCYLYFTFWKTEVFK